MRSKFRNSTLKHAKQILNIGSNNFIRTLNLNPVINNYLFLYEKYGPTNSWPWGKNTKPTKSPEEIIIGAILTQNTNWNNVEKALNNIKRHTGQNIVQFNILSEMDTKTLEELIRPAGYYRQKAQYLKNTINAFNNNPLLLNTLKLAQKNFSKNQFSQEIELTTLQPTNSSQTTSVSIIRNELLKTKGIGNETADTILTYALLLPSFVVDAYLKRFIIAKNIKIQDLKQHQKTKNSNPKTNSTPNTNYKNRFQYNFNYNTIKNYFENALLPIKPKYKLYVYQQYHALIVLWGKENKPNKTSS